MFFIGHFTFSKFSLMIILDYTISLFILLMVISFCFLISLVMISYY